MWVTFSVKFYWERSGEIKFVSALMSLLFPVTFIQFSVFLSFSSIALWILEEDGRSCMNELHPTGFIGEFLHIILHMLNNCLVLLTGVRGVEERGLLAKSGLPAACLGLIP